MRFLYSSLLFLFSLSLNFAQPLTTLESEGVAERILHNQTRPTLKGQLTNFESADLKDLLVEYVIVSITAAGQSGYLPLDVQADGSFELTLPYSHPYQQLWFKIGDYYYGELLINTDLEITANLKKIKRKPVRFWGKGISFAGTDGELTSMTNQLIKYNRKEQLRKSKEMQLGMRDRKSPIADKIKAIDEYLVYKLQLQRDFFKSKPSSFRKFFEAKEKSDYYGNLFVIHWGKPMDNDLLSKAFAHQPVSVSNEGGGYYNYLSTFLRIPTPTERIEMVENILNQKVEDKAALAEFIDIYRKVLNREAYNKEKFKTLNKQYSLLYKDAVDEATLHRAVTKMSQLKGIKGDYLKIKGAPDDVWKREAYLEAVLPTLQTKWAKELLQKEWNADKKHRAEVAQKLKSMQPLDEAATLGENVLNLKNNVQLYTANQDNVEALLQSIRSSFPDKAIVLDVWATWCAPCISDMKRSKAKKEKLKELPLEIVYLCSESGSDEKTWKRKVAELGVKGNHIFLPKKLSSEIMQFFDMSGFPSYVFIDKEGNYDREFVRRIEMIDVDAMKERIGGK